MPQLIYGWVGEKDIIELLKNVFSEEEQKKIYNILHYKIEKLFPDKREIKPISGINKWTPNIYKKEQIDNTPTIVSTLYKISFSAYNKINSLQKYIDIINCQYGINLNINFHFNPLKGYVFILYFGNCSQNNNYSPTLDFEQIMEQSKRHI